MLDSSMCYLIYSHSTYPVITATLQGVYVYLSLQS